MSEDRIKSKLGSNDIKTSHRGKNLRPLLEMTEKYILALAYAILFLCSTIRIGQIFDRLFLFPRMFRHPIINKI